MIRIMECILALPQHPRDTATVSDEPVMLRNLLRFLLTPWAYDSFVPLAPC